MWKHIKMQMPGLLHILLKWGLGIAGPRNQYFTKCPHDSNVCWGLRGPGLGDCFLTLKVCKSRSPHWKNYLLNLVPPLPIYSDIRWPWIGTVWGRAHLEAIVPAQGAITWPTQVGWGPYKHSPLNSHQDILHSTSLQLHPQNAFSHASTSQHEEYDDGKPVGKRRWVLWAELCPPNPYVVVLGPSTSNTGCI